MNLLLWILEDLKITFKNLWLFSLYRRHNQTISLQQQPIIRLKLGKELNHKMNLIKYKVRIRFCKLAVFPSKSVSVLQIKMIQVRYDEKMAFCKMTIFPSESLSVLVL